MLLEYTQSTILIYAFLYLAVILLWAPKVNSISLWQLSAAITLIFGLISHHLTWIGITPIIFLAVITYFFPRCHKQPKLQIVLGCLILVVSVGLTLHTFPGIHNFKALDNILISQNGIPFSLYLNIDKTFIGILQQIGAYSFP